MIQVDNLSFHYKAPLFEKVSFALNAGESMMILGPSGKGKSTLAKILSGHLKPSQGNVTIDGLDVIGTPNRNVILVDQEDDLFPWLNVEKQIFSFCNDHKLTNYLLELFELSHCKGLFPQELSGGMKKRLSMARALSLRPKVLIFDESLSSLDYELFLRVYEKLSSYLKQQQTCSIYITHNPTLFPSGFEHTLVL
jgi:ABC-type multidrug transport system ATPase subunit